MARVLVHGADVADGKIVQLRVRMHNLPARTIHRDVALAWLRDGHSLVTAQGDRPLVLNERVDGDDVTYAIRLDRATEGGDELAGVAGVLGAEV